MEGSSTGFEQGGRFSENGIFRSFSDDGRGSDHIRSIYFFQQGRNLQVLMIKIWFNKRKMKFISDVRTINACGCGCVCVMYGSS